MRTLVLLDARRIARWHSWLVARLAAHPGWEVRVHLEPVAGAPPPAALRLLLDVERRLGDGRPSATDPISPAELGCPVHTTGTRYSDLDVAFDLTGRGSLSAHAARVTIQPTFDGVLSEAALWSALLGRRAPVLGVEVGASAARPVALPAIEHPTRLREAANTVLSRLVQVLATAAVSGAAGLPAAPRDLPRVRNRVPPLTLGAVAFAWARVAHKAERALQHFVGTQERWRVGWRLALNGRSHLAGLAPATSYRMLGDDGARTFADPFVFVHDGLHHVFVKEVPLGTGRGLISHFTVTEDGRASAPRPVLETAHPLSYPQVLAHEGQIYMLPECSASGALVLYRADPFPHRWVPAVRLIEAEVHDATLHAHDGRFYIFAATRVLAASSWDALSVYWAERLEGPWQPLPGNPVLIDVRQSRPAGALYWMDGALWRPAQDCTGGYGAALALARVTRLDNGGFAQEVAARLKMPGPAGAHGPHTINWASGLEVIDFLA